MEQHGRTLADSHKFGLRPGPDHLLARLVENEGVLTEAFGIMAEAAQASRRITPAAEWLLDNSFLIEEEIRTARRHFPEKYSLELPRLAKGPSAGLPRVYDIALEAVSHGDARVDPESLNRFVAAYQSVEDLKLGELWAIPIMLRLALIENLRRVGARVVAGMIDRNRADEWADEMISVAEKDPTSLILVIADMARSNPPLVNSFVAALARRLQGQSSALALPLTWIEQRLSASGSTIEQMVQSETQSQAANQLSISNSIGSLRALGAIDWREFVETMSSVERILREDPDGVYGRMDFATRDRYRHVVEAVARHSSVSESEVARKAIDLSRGSEVGHVGFFLIDKGLVQLEQAVGVRLPWDEVVRRGASRFPLSLYLGGTALLTAFFTLAFALKGRSEGVAPWWVVAIAVPALLATSQLAVALVNWLATMVAAPDLLPRLDFSRGIAPGSRTLVVVPTMLASLKGVDDLAEALEVRFLANQDPRLHFGLLTDFLDAREETRPEDEALLRRARERIEALNLRYENPDRDTFFLFHRPRTFNPRDRIWMGYERKRGKLGALNALIREGSKEPFSLIVGEMEILREVKYVITLDTDTQLPRDSARQLVAAMAHPLNRPRYDEARQRVVAGYGILQPRMAVSLPSTNRSRYARLLGSEAGLDPYTRAVSDVYQDLFHEGSFIGKGIYEVEAFERALKDRFPENRILSHDLLEGCYARAGMLSDVHLYEDTPPRYGMDAARRHRWIRGDWQIASWLFARVPGSGRDRLPNPLSVLSQWKLLDNLRRSLVPAALTLLFLLGWIQVPSMLPWTLMVMGVIFLPVLLTSFVHLARRPKDVRLRQHVFSAARSAALQFAQGGLLLACLPFEAHENLDAIGRTCFRMWVSGRRLLEWKPSSAGRDVVSHRRPDRFSGLTRTFATMWIGPAAAAATALYLGAARPSALMVAAPVLFCWFTAPALAWWLSLPLHLPPAKLRPEQTAFLRKLARRTWGFFDTFVTAADHWLPPDNFQEHPVAILAHRTSPTNMGLSLLSNLSAYDFGYISAGRLLERTANALETMQALERYRGHFFNWYDTLTLKPLPPSYVSSVDSGNLSGHLLTLAPGLRELPDRSILGPRTIEGLGDTLAVLLDFTEEAGTADLLALRGRIDVASRSRPETLAAARIWLGSVLGSARAVASRRSAETTGAAEASAWARSLATQAEAVLSDLDFMAPHAALREVPGRLREMTGLGGIPTVRELSALGDALSDGRAATMDGSLGPDERAWLEEARPLITLASQRANDRLRVIDHLAGQSADLAAIEYDFLYDQARHLMTVGFNVDRERRDSGHYDLLASEARFSTFVAIARGDAPQESWFALGRLLTSEGGESALLSWSGSMFEYLMPLLVMPTYENSLLDHTCLAAVNRQIAYGSQRGVPWGISESGYNAVDATFNYQYRAFGVPGLGLKRGLADDLVIAPYASALALMVRPGAACRNLERLAGLGLLGAYGMYEAVDYTPARLPRGQPFAVVRSFMAHHQGMSLLALESLLLHRPMQRRFESDPQFQATTLLLQERIPAAAAFHLRPSETSEVRSTSTGPEMPMRVLHTSDTPAPEVQLLSNGRYHVMVTNAGGGYSRWKDIAVTRWREDATRDNWGAFSYIRDVATGQFWSTAHQPTLKRAEAYEAIFSEARAEFRRRDSDYETHTVIVVSPEDDIELRRTRITNRKRARRTVEVTTYAEVVLAAPAADALHPAFSNLFVQTEIVSDRQAILCTRRARSAEERMPWMFHLAAAHGATAEAVSYETDRSRFIGRAGGIDSPLALTETEALSGGEGSVLDPIVAIRLRITLDPGQTVTIDVATGVSENRDTALGLVSKYRDRHLADRVIDLAWTHSRVNLQQINATESDAQLYGRLAGSILYMNPLLRAGPAELVRNHRGQSGLWGYAISGDLPIVLLKIADATNIELVRQLVQAHAYWRLKGLAVDLVIWNEDHAGYRQFLQEQIMGLIAAGLPAILADRPGGIFVRAAEQISNEDRTLFQTVARVIIADSRGSLSDQVGRRAVKETRPALLSRLVPTRRPAAEAASISASPEPARLFFNGLGGFSPDGREYVITLGPGRTTPAPWANVLANDHFGSVISESGASYTWSENAHEFRFTPWANDPVTDSTGEAIYIRDEETGRFWSPAPSPCRGVTTYVTRHGFGYSVFEHEEDGIRSELTIHVDGEAAVKFSALRITNRSGRARSLSVTGYVEWVLGDLRPKTAMHVVTEIDAATGAICARNPYSAEFADRIAFFDADEATRAPGVTLTADRVEFLGRTGTLASPVALTRLRLSNRVGAGLDACGAIQVPVDLAPGQERTVIFRLGAAGRRGSDDAARRLRGVEAYRRSLGGVREYWSKTLGVVQVTSPDPSVDLLANGWLLYQTLACRVWARSGYYQSGGAFGFRDQLQDTMALVHAEPRLMREHLLRSAARQFSEGDVQHWWHPPAGRGVRTHCSDDFLWLPQAICRYVVSTGDHQVLEEPVHFLEGRPVNPEQDSYYDLPARSESAESLYQHGVRAITRGLRFGAHGLPLMGSGDWNDGMNLVGMQGRGESVWLGFFLYDTLLRFGALARARGDASFADRCRLEAGLLQGNLEKHAWDGGWYRRAYFDDGTPLGSAMNEECQIDSIAQSWSVLSGAAVPARSRLAMDALDRRLVRRDRGLIQLLDPPFDKSDLNPGYIKGYVPGVRENGGQYTHAAIWASMAFATMGDPARAWELFDLINPIRHSDSPEGVATYRVEPYVVAADVYGVAPHIGRGGWTWYTGSAGWMYRLITESLLGLRVESGKLRIDPCLPPQWPGFNLRYRHLGTTYAIAVTRRRAAEGSAERAGLTLDGVFQEDVALVLVDDGREHRVEVRLEEPISRT